MLYASRKEYKIEIIKILNSTYLPYNSALPGFSFKHYEKQNRQSKYWIKQSRYAIFHPNKVLPSIIIGFTF